VPLIACAENPSSTLLPDTDKQNLWYWSDLITQWGFGFAKLLIRASSGQQSNLAALIIAAVQDISKSMVMVVVNTANPQSNQDTLAYVSCIQTVNAGILNPTTTAAPCGTSPPAGSRTYLNVKPGDKKVYEVSFLVPAGQNTVDGYQITLNVLGFGSTVITVTNQTHCPGCQGNTNNRQDMCGFCNPPAGQANQCVDCAGVVGGKSVVDLCGICGGDNSACTDCRGVAVLGGNFSYKIDACGICSNVTSPTFGKSCIGCDGLLKPGAPAQYDLCGVCNGNNACVDCEEVVNGPAYVDGCGVCITAVTQASATCKPASVAINAGAAAGIAVGIALFVALAVIAAIIIFAKVTKNFIDERKFMNAFAAGNTVGTNPLHQEKAGWQQNVMNDGN